MLETTLVALQDITLDKIFDESGRKALFADFAKLMEQVISSSEERINTFPSSFKIINIYIVVCSFYLLFMLQPHHIFTFPLYNLVCFL